MAGLGLREPKKSHFLQDEYATESNRNQAEEDQKEEAAVFPRKLQQLSIRKRHEMYSMWTSGKKKESSHT